GFGTRRAITLSVLLAVNGSSLEFQIARATFTSIALLETINLSGCIRMGSPFSSFMCWKISSNAVTPVIERATSVAGRLATTKGLFKRVWSVAQIGLLSIVLKNAP